MVTIRMRRLGSKKRPFFRVVATDARTPRDGRSIEILGHYDPTTQPETLRLNRDRFHYWLDKGARPSDTVRTLLARHEEKVTAANMSEAANTEKDAT